MFTRRKLLRTEENATQLKTAILPQFVRIEPHFVRKRCGRHFRVAILHQLLTIEPHFVQNSCAGRFKIAI